MKMSLRETDYDNPDHWYSKIEADGLWPWTPWRVTLNCGLLRYGPEGWGWSCMTLGGAERLAARKLASHRAKLRRTQRRNARVAASQDARMGGES